MIQVLISSTLCSSRKSSLSSSKTTSGESVALCSTLWTHLSGATMVKKYFFELCGITYSRPPRLVLWKFQLKFGNVVKLLVKWNWSTFFLIFSSPRTCLMEISIKVFGNVVKCFFYVIGQSYSTLYIYIYYILYIYNIHLALL